MATLQILNQEPITMSELRVALDKVKKRDGELNFRANKTEEHLKNMQLLKPKDAKELAKALAALDVPRLKPEHIVKIIDLLPSSLEELKVIISGYSVTVNADNCKKITDTVCKYV